MFRTRHYLVVTAANAAVALSLPQAGMAFATATPVTPAAKKVAASEPPVPKLTSAQIVEKHVAARGGAQAWKAVQTLELSGTMEAGRGDSIERAQKMVDQSRVTSAKAKTADVVAANATPDANKQVALPFKLELKRPNLTRLEIQFAGKTAVQVFDGQQGWKYRPFLNRTDAEPYTRDEVSQEAARGDLDGPLMSSAASGAKIEVEGSDLIDSQPAYRLKVTASHQAPKHIWIDAKTFLDVKVEGAAKRMDGKMHPVYTYQRDFRPVQGVLLPFALETQVDGYPQTHKTLVEKATVNPSLAASAFSKPHA